MTNCLLYYDVNVNGTVNLFRCMENYQIKNIIFSSSASVYGRPLTLPIYETNVIDPISVYGDTKAMAETMLHRLAANNNWTVVILRYFNPYGAHESGLLGEHQKSTHVPNLIEIMTEAALGKRETLTIFGQSHNTPDGTPIRDFIHIVDLARGHTCALKLFGTNKEHIFNLGTGVGTTVKQAIKCFSAVCGKELKVVYADARVGDPPILIANSDKANAALGWRAEKDFMKMCVDYWKWLKMNPKGYQS
jgi:UDP-glucose 4-epimerase